MEVDLRDDFGAINLISVVCEVVIDRSLLTGLDVTMDVGSITLLTGHGVDLNGVSLATKTGGVEANLGPGTTLREDVSLSTTTRGVDLQWEDVGMVRDTSVILTTSTGGARAVVRQPIPTGHDLELVASSITGGTSAGPSRATSHPPSTGRWSWGGPRSISRRVSP